MCCAAAAAHDGALVARRSARRMRGIGRAGRTALRSAAAVVVLALAGCAPLRYVDALRVLGDLAAGEGPSRLKERTPPPSRTAVRYAVSGREHAGDLYLPGDAPPLAGIVLVPGAVPKGKDDPRLVALARTLARARFAVLTPEVRGFRELRILPGDAREVADAFAWLVARPDWAPEGRAGLFAVSYAVGPAVLAALEPDVRERVAFVVGLGGYHDLRRTIRYFTTGAYQTRDGAWHHLAPDDYGKLVLVNAARPYLAGADAAILDRMVARRLEDRGAELSGLAVQLGPQGRAVYELAENTRPLRFGELYAGLPAAMRSDVEALSLHDKDLSRLHARLILVHGRNDDLIPWPESEALADAAGRERTRLFLLHAILTHVDMRLPRWFDWHFLGQALPDVVRLWRAVDALLAERERHEEPARAAG